MTPGALLRQALSRIAWRRLPAKWSASGATSGLPGKSARRSAKWLAAWLGFPLALLIAGSAHETARRTEQALQHARQETTRLQHARASAQTAHDAWRQHQETLRQLRQAGIARNQPPGDDHATLRAWQRELRLPLLQTQWPGTSATASAGASTGTTSGTTAGMTPDTDGWHTAGLTLHARLLHEGDLLHLLNRLQDAAPARVVVHGCQLRAELATASGEKTRNNSGSPQPTAPPTGLIAACTLQWTTLHLPAPTGP